MPNTHQKSPDWSSPLFVRVTARVAAWVWRWNDDRVGQRPALGRLTAHVALVLMLALLVVLGSLQLDSAASIVRVADKAFFSSLVQNVDAAAGASTIVERPYYRVASQARIVRQAQAHTAIPERPRLEIITYTVQAGDTAETIAASFGLQPTTLLWSNPEMEKMPDLLRVGQVLTILPIDGVYHTIGVSDTLESLAQTYSVDVESILTCQFNTLGEGGLLVEGEQLIIPGGTKPYEARQVVTYAGPAPSESRAEGTFQWPAGGSITQGYWYGHRAIDIGAPLGTAIWSSDGGYVSFTGWTDIGYGYLVVVDHSNGYETFYAHLSDIYVREGEVVRSGQVIGAMGSTGNSTGPHLHFEIRYNGFPTNPLIYLP